MEIIQVINAVHEDSIAGMAYNRVKKEIYTCADGDRAIKVLFSKAAHAAMATEHKADRHYCWCYRSGTLRQASCCARRSCTEGL